MNVSLSHARQESVTRSPNGKLYIAESDLVRNNRVYRVNPLDDTITHVMGADPECDCGSYRCSCYGGEGNLPREEPIYAPMDVVFTVKGRLVIAEQGELDFTKPHLGFAGRVLLLRIYVCLCVCPLAKYLKKYLTNQPHFGGWLGDGGGVGGEGFFLLTPGTK